MGSFSGQMHERRRGARQRGGEHETRSPNGLGLRTKHAVDRVLAGVVLLIAAPLLVVVAIAVKLSSPGPILYRQRRIGRAGRPFDLLKFRSMRVDDDDPPFAPQPGRAPGGVEGADRRTRLGRLMRRSALDELPQLWNVIRGDMSLVGPRPERPHYAALFAKQIPGYADRHSVQPGLTGLAQVRGLRGQTSIHDRTRADLEYITTWSLRLDLLILLLTPVAVVFSSGDA